MSNFKKIGQMMLVILFVCTFAGEGECQLLPAANSERSYTIPGGYGLTTTITEKGVVTSDSAGNVVQSYSTPEKAESTSASTKPATSGEDQAAAVPAGTSDTPSTSAVTGCSSDYGLFSGLIKTGRDIFNGLRDLIYVVAGFGIIGIAVGGFFGNLNWKWLGAVMIALVVIATTGEIINMITGCKDFTQAMITDTLK